VPAQPPRRTPRTTPAERAASSRPAGGGCLNMASSSVGRTDALRKVALCEDVSKPGRAGGAAPVGARRRVGTDWLTTNSTKDTNRKGSDQTDREAHGDRRRPDRLAVPSSPGAPPFVLFVSFVVQSPPLANRSFRDWLSTARGGPSAGKRSGQARHDDRPALWDADIGAMGRWTSGTGGACGEQPHSAFRSDGDSAVPSWCPPCPSSS